MIGIPYFKDMLEWERGPKKEDGIWMWYKKIHQDIELADEYISKIQAEKKKRQNTLKSLKNMVIETHATVGKLPEHSEFNPIKVLESKSLQ